MDATEPVSLYKHSSFSTAKMSSIGNSKNNSPGTSSAGGPSPAFPRNSGSSRRIVAPLFDLTRESNADSKPHGWRQQFMACPAVLMTTLMRLRTRMQFQSRIQGKTQHYSQRRPDIRDSCSMGLTNTPVESKTRTHHGRVGSGGARRCGWAGRARQDGTPTCFPAQDTTVARAPLGIEDKCPEHLSGSTNKGNTM